MGLLRLLPLPRVLRVIVGFLLLDYTLYVWHWLNHRSTLLWRFHAVHHLWPSIPYYNLPTADRLIRQHPGAAGLEWRGSYFAYLLTYWSAFANVAGTPTHLVAVERAGPSHLLDSLRAQPGTTSEDLLHFLSEVAVEYHEIWILPGQLDERRSKNVAHCLGCHLTAPSGSRDPPLLG